ncbi:tetratricopeptide repeat protein [Microbispora sp. NEAU-D428]|nr:tetratricopeptide repeat protein [Microbispora sitophila]
MVRLLDGLRQEDHSVESRLLLGDALMRLGRFEQADAVLAESHEKARSEDHEVTAAGARTYNLF